MDGGCQVGPSNADGATRATHEKHKERLVQSPSRFPRMFGRYGCSRQGSDPR